MNMSLKNLAKTYPWTQDAANAAINKFQGGATEACIIMMHYSKARQFCIWLLHGRS